jgi:hypothetical protein
MAEICCAKPLIYTHLPTIQIICKGNLRLSGLIKETSKRRRSKRQLMPRRFWRHKIRPRNIHKRRIKRIKRMANVNEFQLKFNVSQKMVPSCRILVYYVREDKEVVGDSIVYNVEDKLENQVTCWDRSNNYNYTHLLFFHNIFF